MERKNIDNKIILYNKGGIKVFKVTLIFFQEIKKYFSLTVSLSFCKDQITR